MAVHRVAGQRQEIALPADDRRAIGMDLERCAEHRLVQPPCGIVFATFALRKDDRSLALRHDGIEVRVDHAIRLDRERERDPIRR